MTAAQRPKPLPRQVWLLSWVSFFADVSGEMIYPLLPLFLVGALGASKTQLGAMEGMAAFLVAFMSAYAGFRSDRKSPDGRGGRVPWLRWGYGMPVVGKAIMAAATAWPMAMGGRLFDRWGKGLRGAPRDALIADAIDAEQRGRAFGLHRTLDTTGALLGVLLAAFLLWWLTGAPTKPAAGQAMDGSQATPTWVFRAIIGVGAGLGLASFVLTFLVRESEPRPEATPPQEPAAEALKAAETSESGVGPWAMPRSYWKALAALGLFSLANSSDAFLLLRVAELGHAPWAVVLAYALFNVFYAGLAYPAGVLSDRLGRWKVIAAGWAVFAGVYVGFACLSAERAWGVWPLMAGYGAYMALTEGVNKALIADHVPPTRRGAGMGLFHGLTGLTSLAASLLAGAAWDRWGPQTTFLIGAGFAVAALGAIPWVAKRKPANY